MRGPIHNIAKAEVFNRLRFFNEIQRSRRQVFVRLSQVTVFHLTLMPRDYITRVALLFVVTAQGFRRRTMADEVVRRHRFDDFTESQEETFGCCGRAAEDKASDRLLVGSFPKFLSRKRHLR